MYLYISVMPRSSNSELSLFQKLQIVHTSQNSGCLIRIYFSYTFYFGYAVLIILNLRLQDLGGLGMPSESRSRFGTFASSDSSDKLGIQGGMTSFVFPLMRAVYMTSKPILLIPMIGSSRALQPC